MDIAKLSTNTSNMKAGSAIGIRVLKMAMDTQEQQGMQLANMISKTAEMYKCNN